jgi:uncharacterized DUF497 family protein
MGYSLGSGKKPLSSVYPTVNEFLLAHHLDPKMEESRAALASMIEDGEAIPPLELQGNGVSSNGQCEWDKTKAFINQYKHGVSFEEVSLLYSERPPLGFKVIYDDPTDKGTGLGSVWGFDIRDWVVAKIGKRGCILVKVDREHTFSGRVRLISARPVSEKVALKAIQDHELNSSVSVTARVIFNSFGREYATSMGQMVRDELFSRIQAYENIRYLSSIM